MCPMKLETHSTFIVDRHMYGWSGSLDWPDFGHGITVTPGVTFPKIYSGGRDDNRQAL